MDCGEYRFHLFSTRRAWIQESYSRPSAAQHIEAVDSHRRSQKLHQDRRVSTLAGVEIIEAREHPKPDILGEVLRVARSKGLTCTTHVPPSLGEEEGGESFDHPGETLAVTRNRLPEVK